MMRKCILAFIFIVLASRFGVAYDLGRLMQAQPKGGDDTFTSNVAFIMGFYSARSQGNIASSISDTDTYTQYYADGTTSSLSRAVVFNELLVQNLTSYTLYVMPNCGMFVPSASSSGSAFINETTPTLSPTYFLDVLGPYTDSAPPYMVWRNSVDDKAWFPVINVGVYIATTASDGFKSSATLQAEVTSATLRIIGR